MSIRTTLQIAGAMVMLAAPGAARAERITLVERPDHTTEATVDVDAPPDEVYALVTDYASWTRVLSDVSDVSIRSGGRDNASVHFRSRALAHAVTIVFANEPGRRISFRGIEGPPGGRASGAYTLTPIDGGRRTHVVATLYLDVVGVASVFVRDKKLRAMREAKLTADLDDVVRHFAPRPVR